MVYGVCREHTRSRTVSSRSAGSTSQARHRRNSAAAGRPQPAPPGPLAKRSVGARLAVLPPLLLQSTRKCRFLCPERRTPPWTAQSAAEACHPRASLINKNYRIKADLL